MFDKYCHVNLLNQDLHRFTGIILNANSTSDKDHFH